MSGMQIMRDWPAVLDARMAVDYSGLARSEIQRAAREGRLAFKPLGPRGRKVVLRAQVDALLTAIFAEKAAEPVEDFDFGSS